VTGKGGRRRKQLLGNIKKNRGCCQLKEEAPAGILWRTRFARGYGPS